MKYSNFQDRPIVSGHIPYALLEKPNWVFYKLVPDRSRKGKDRKIPLKADMTPADVTNPGHWTYFNDLVDTLPSNVVWKDHDGMGFVFDGTGLCGIDLDNVVAEDGTINPEAQKLLDAIPGYKEYSPSDRGIHIITLGTPPWTGARHGEISVEVYTDKRYFTVTTDTLPDSLLELTEPVDLSILSKFDGHSQRLETRNGEEFLANLKEADPLWTLDRVESELLSALPDYPYPEWRQIACALHHQFNGSEEAYELFDKYSAKGDLYAGPVDTRKLWDSIRDVRGKKLVTIGTLIHLANANKSVRRLVEQSSPQLADEPLLMKLKDAKKNIKSIEWLIDGYVKAESLIMIGGAPASGKTYVALDMALCVATGRSWLGEYKTQMGDAILVACEGRDSVCRRAWAWEALKNGGEEVERAYITQAEIVVGTDPDVHNSTESLARFIDENGLSPKIIVIDTMNFSLGTCNENDSNDMTEYFTRLARNLIRRFHCVVVLVHHTNKGKTDIRGSSVIRGALDALYFVEQKDGQFVVENDKHKDRDKGDIPTLYLNPKVTEITLADGRTETNIALFKGSQVVVKDGLTAGQEKLIKVMQEAVGVGGSMDKRTLREELGVDSKNWARDFLNPLVAAGYLRSDGDPKQIVLIKTGDTAYDDFAV